MLDVHVLHLPSDKCPDEPYPSPSNLEKITGNTEQLCVRGNGIRILGSTVLLSRYALTESCGFLLAMYPVVSSWPYILRFLLGHISCGFFLAMSQSTRQQVTSCNLTIYIQRVASL